MWKDFLKDEHERRLRELMARLGGSLGEGDCVVADTEGREDFRVWRHGGCLYFTGHLWR